VRHIVQEGETLETLAQHYYGDGARAADIQRANEDVLKEGPTLAPGMSLIIPGLK
jgi:nucleoid-associated protein YgaU